MSKYFSKRVYLCPVCWGEGIIAKKYKDSRICNGTPKSETERYKKPITLDSQEEYAFLLRIHGKPGISDIEIHPAYELKDDVEVDGTSFPFFWKRKTDFAYRENGNWRTVDVKGRINKKGMPHIIKPMEYKQKCWMIEKIYGTPVLTYSSGIFFRWNWGKNPRTGKLEVVR